MGNGIFQNPTGVDGEDPVCIVGCRIPGGIRSPSALWDFLVQKNSAQGRVPLKRFNVDGFYHPDGNRRAGAIDADGGYFLDEDVRQFENSFFGINNLEATYALIMDPQQRKLLEVVFECFENAGVPMEEISGSNTGVYVGNFTVDFESMQTRDPDYLHRYHGTGTGIGIMANRISHVFNLHGPSFTLDTACSSTLYCLHNAVVALKNNECDGAIVAGANLITGPEQHIVTVKGGVISPTSTCHTFDASADGYGRAEAVNAIYLKRLSVAIQNGDNIYAVIRGTAVNANGKTLGITQPSAALQEAVIRKAYSVAGLHFADTDYVECHGTGTAVGDPIEIDGIGRCFSPRKGPALIVGAVKTNIGHSEATSGLSSIIKVTLAFEHGQIPPTRGVHNLNPKSKLDFHIPFESLNMKVATELQPWPRSIRRASINSFGFGGANAHVILESFDSYQNRSDIRGVGARDPRAGIYVLPISAVSSHSLQRREEYLLHAIQDISIGSGNTDALAYTLAKRRSHFKSRGFLLVNDKGNVLNENSGRPTTVSSLNESRGLLPIAFICTGQGAQFPGMARELIINDVHSFSSTIRKLDSVLRRLPVSVAPSWTLRETILEPETSSHIHDVSRSQPVCTAIQIALIELLQSWNISPVSTVGHSSGEIAAAYGAGLLTAEEAILIAFFRGLAMKELCTSGSMMAAGLSFESAEKLLVEHDLKGRVCVACVNSPENVTFSGIPQGIETLFKVLNGEVFVRKLETGGSAYHSHLMQEVGDLYEKYLERYAWDESIINDSLVGQAQMVSSVGYGPSDIKIVDRKTVATSKYWRNNLERPVQFSSAVEKLVTGTKLYLIEVGPHAALRGPIEQIRRKLETPKEDLPYSYTLYRGKDSDQCVKSLAGDLFLRGYSLNWSAINGWPEKITNLKPVHNLPPYPWDYSAGLLWNEPRSSVELRNRRYVRHELLGSSQLAGNGIDFSWRNILKLEEIPWLRDHKLEAQIAFPAAAYLSLAIEALSQLCDLDSVKPNTLFQFQNVSIMTAFVVNDSATTKDTELHTTMCARKLSTSNKSKDWYEFSISSWVAGLPTLHCAGSIRVNGDACSEDIKSFSKVTHVDDASGYEDQDIEKWYAKIGEEGLRFGPKFRSLRNLRTDGRRVRPEAISTTMLIQRDNQNPISKYPETQYNVHPIVIDACFQAAIMGATAGNLGDLKGQVPTFISKCQIRTPDSAWVSTEATIHTNSRKSGPVTQQIDSTLYDENGEPVVIMEEVRLFPYDGKITSNPIDSNNQAGLQRHPCLKIEWKPDIMRLSTGLEAQLRQYISHFKSKRFPDIADAEEEEMVIGALLDLAGHRRPRMRVLDLSKESDSVRQTWRNILDDGSAFPRYLSWSVGELKEGEISVSDENVGIFDIVVATEPTASTIAQKLPSLLSPDGVVLIRKECASTQTTLLDGFEQVVANKRCSLMIPSGNRSSLLGKDILIIVHDPSDMITRYAKYLEEYLLAEIGVASANTIHLVQFPDVEITQNLACISLLELEKELLATMNLNEMALLQKIVNTATDLVWVTGSGILSSNIDPNLTFVSGFSRAIMLEQPSLRFSVLDIGKTCVDVSREKLIPTYANIAKVLVASNDFDDKEFIQVDDLLYISRFVPDTELNSLFRRRLNSPTQGDINTKPLFEASPARLMIDQPGSIDTLHFQEMQDHSEVPAGFIDIDVKAVSINAKDIYTMMGRVGTPEGTTSCELCGVVISVGLNVDLKPGDRVVVLAPTHFSTIERVPAWTAHKLLPGEDFPTMAALSVAYTTALYALCDRAQLRPGESILIHAGAGAFGIAAITIAQRIGATVYTTVSSPKKREFLVQKLGVPDGQIFQSRDASFVSSISKVTKGRGVDVIINSLVGDLMHESWACLAKFGRFIEVGKRELLDAGKLDMGVFLRNATFTAFDLTDLYYAGDYYKDVLASKMREVFDLYRSGKIRPIPISTFDVGEIIHAFRHFADKNRIGKVVISLENPQSRIPTIPARYKSAFDPEKAYLLVGCLGGLGRSLGRWMMARGARRFVFLGRSGTDKPDAKNFVSLLENSGADVRVVRGDVSNLADVKVAVEACCAMGAAVGGVVQAAMGLHESIFSSMGHGAWHTSIQPKWAGTWNLHSALKGHNLDFFLMTSSVSGSVGTATESNYCAANSFLDAFAQWQRQQGVPAISVGLGMISEVGYLHENPDIEALLLRKGIQPLNEEEFLQVIDFALSGNTPTSDSCSNAHILTGLEPLGLRTLISKGFNVDNVMMQDPRASIISTSLYNEKESRNAEKPGLSNHASGAARPEWLKSVPANLTEPLFFAAGGGTLYDAILNLVRKRFSDVMLIQQDQIENFKPLAQFGLDSMIAAELRTWFWRTFKVDVPFFNLMSPTENINTLAKQVEANIVCGDEKK
ncbi:polyketide synthase [Daldinia sp. FL1419]|nr:polyketide synthase [Daldinia sp. FL1419]